MTVYDIKHDMQVLLILMLTYNIYFGCIIYEVLKFSTAKAFTLRVPKNYTIISLNDFDNTSKSNEKSHYLDIYLRLCHDDFIQRFIANKFAQVKIEELKLSRYCKNARRVSYPHFHTNISRMHRRKLLGCERHFCECPTKYKSRMHRDIGTKKTLLTRKKRENIVAKNSQLNDEVLETWDNWSNWSVCSVTCGQGQQVRWRHCLSENCIKGLKKAQLKSCHIKDCDTKGFLGWLGIKS